MDETECRRDEGDVLRHPSTENLSITSEPESMTDGSLSCQTSVLVDGKLNLSEQQDSTPKSKVQAKHTDVLMTKFKFCLRRYNRELLAVCNSQASLKGTRRKLVELRNKLLQSGEFTDDDLTFSSENDVHSGDDDGAKFGTYAALDISSTTDELNEEVVTSSRQLSEIQKDRLHKGIVESKVTKGKTKVNIASDSNMSPQPNKMLHELQQLNEELKSQLFQSKTAADELHVLNMNAVSAQEKALAEIDELKQKMKKKEDATKLQCDSLSLFIAELKDEFVSCQQENESMRNAVEELKNEHKAAFDECRKLTELWTTTNEQLAHQDETKKAIITDFIKLGVSYKKLHLRFEAIAGDNSSLKHKMGQLEAQYAVFRSKKMRPSIMVRKVAVQTSRLRMNSWKKFPPLEGLPPHDQSSGDSMRVSENTLLRERVAKLERKLAETKKNSKKLLEKHKLLSEQMTKLDEQCHLQLDENGRLLKLVEGKRGKSKHSEGSNCMKSKHTSREKHREMMKNDHRGRHGYSHRTSSYLFTNENFCKKKAHKNCSFKSAPRKSWVSSLWVRDKISENK